MTDIALTVAISSATGASASATAIATVTTPIVTNQSTSLDLLLANPQSIIATMSASNSPTSWAIVGGDLGGFFKIDNSGNLRCTVTGELGLVPGTQVLTVLATNAFGSGQGTATLTVANPHGRVLYVSTSGSDSNNGSSSPSAWRTVSHAAATAIAGDLVLIAPGTYTDFTNIDGIRMDGVGTATNPIVFRSQVRAGAILDGMGNVARHQGIFNDNAAWNIIAGFKIQNCTLMGVFVARSNNVRYRYNEIAFNGSLNTGSNQGQNGIYEDTGCADNVYISNFIHHNGRIALATNLDQGLYLTGQRSQVINNIVWNNCAYGIQLGAYTSLDGYNIFNNVIGNQTTRSGIVFWQAVSGTTFSNFSVKNNIFVNNNGLAIHWNNGGTPVTNCVTDTNIAFGNPGGLDDGQGVAGYTSQNWTQADPQFVSASPAVLQDFVLKATSPGVDHGMDIGVIIDILGNIRPIGSGFDIGAFEQ
jgi:hypothetical protein